MAKSNGRITLAVLGEQLKHLTAKLDEVHADVRCLRVESARQEERIDGLEDDHHDLRGRVNAWAALNSIFIAIGTMLGVIFGKR